MLDVATVPANPNQEADAFTPDGYFRVNQQKVTTKKKDSNLLGTCLPGS